MWCARAPASAGRSPRLVAGLLAAVSPAGIEALDLHLEPEPDPARRGARPSRRRSTRWRARSRRAGGCSSRAGRDGRDAVPRARRRRRAAAPRRVAGRPADGPAAPGERRRASLAGRRRRRSLILAAGLRPARSSHELQSRLRRDVARSLDYLGRGGAARRRALLGRADRIVGLRSRRVAGRRGRSPTGRCSRSLGVAAAGRRCARGRGRSASGRTERRARRRRARRRSAVVGRSRSPLVRARASPRSCPACPTTTTTRSSTRCVLAARRAPGSPGSPGSATPAAAARSPRHGAAGALPRGALPSRRLRRPRRVRSRGPRASPPTAAGGSRTRRPRDDRDAGRRRAIRRSSASRRSRTTNAVRFPLEQRGSTPGPARRPRSRRHAAHRVVCDPLFEEVVGAACGGPAEDAWLAERGLDARAPVDRSQAGARRVISSYGVELTGRRRSDRQENANAGPCRPAFAVPETRTWRDVQVVPW